MNEDLVYRPTSAATADELAAQLCNIRTCTRRVTDDLSTRQLMGPMLPIVNPILWEIGHVGWFHEYWTLRHAHGEAPILDRADRLWNSSTVAHATRWDLDLPDRNGVFGYMADVLGRQLDRLGSGIELPACYFYDLSIRHEDMHVEALVYTRQTLGYARPERLGDPASHRAGAWRGDVEVPGGRWRRGPGRAPFDAATAELGELALLQEREDRAAAVVVDDEDRVDHLLKLRELQDETHGFQTFIPLAFHPDNTPLQHLPKTTGMLDIKQIAVSRLVLDNFPHIKAYWQMMTAKIAQIALRFGADDIDGTVIEEKIYHDAGATTPQGMRRKDLIRLISEAGREPIERDTLYRPVTRTETSVTVAV